jgi:anti-anti-sigma regulatory factor
MPHKPSHHMPQDIYHRIYWYAKRNVDPHVIAHTLKIPLKSVERLIEKLSSAESLKLLPQQPELDAIEGAKPDDSQPKAQDFLDMFVFAKTRYTVIDFSGMVTTANADKLNAEIKMLLSSDWKTIALRMADVTEIDDYGFKAIVGFYNAFVNMRHHTAILDPSPEVDKFLETHNQTAKVPVFGTESAFEEHSFR